MLGDWRTTSIAVPTPKRAPSISPFALCLRTAAATIGAGAIERLALDDVVLADVECRPDDTAIAVIGEHLVALSS